MNAINSTVEKVFLCKVCYCEDFPNGKWKLTGVIALRHFGQDYFLWVPKPSQMFLLSSSLHPSCMEPIVRCRVQTSVFITPTDEKQRKWTNEVKWLLANGKTLCHPACLLSKPRKTVKKGLSGEGKNETERGGTFGRGVIRHYISDEGAKCNWSY